MARNRPNINKEDTWKMVKPEDVPQATLQMVKKELGDHRAEMIKLFDTRLDGVGKFMGIATDNRALIQILGVVVIVGFIVGGIFIARSF